ncbi:MAG: hypothetical protein P8N02_02290 [Actinomycetota bacterium]|nr:hypothetical protein [Actinomycetota bacterium]
MGGASDPSEGDTPATLDAIGASDLVVITHGGELAQRYVAHVVDHGVAHITHTPLVDDLHTFNELQTR